MTSLDPQQPREDQEDSTSTAPTQTSRTAATTRPGSSAQPVQHLRHGERRAAVASPVATTQPTAEGQRAGGCAARRAGAAAAGRRRPQPTTYDAAYGDDEGGRGVLGRRRADERDRGDDVGRRDPALDEEDRAVQLEGVEAAQHQVVDGEEQDAEAEQRERRGVGVDAASAAAPCRRPPARSGAITGSSATNGTITASAVRSVLAERAAPAPAVALGGVRGEPRQHRGRQRDRDDRVRDHHDQEATE